MQTHAVVASAPGKVMLSGEYAVLRGAPALVLAVDREVHVTLRRADVWRASSDLAPNQMWSGAALPTTHDNPAVALLGLLAQGRASDTPLGLDVASRALRDGDIKLGLGSSAAVSVAATAARARLDDMAMPQLAEVIAFHDTLQGKAGSGADVACSLSGGLVSFRRDGCPHVDQLALPGLAMCFLWTGVAANTVNFIAGFEAFCAQPSSGALLDELALAAGCCADAAAARNDGELLAALARYAVLTRQLHDAAKLPIYGAGHEQLRLLSEQHPVVYKPCGAGGGDLGVALAVDHEALERFVVAAREAGLRPVDLGPRARGVEVTVTCGDEQ